MKKIYVSLIGGFGNQLFIYAFSKYLSKKFNIKVILDTSFYQTSKIKIELEKFNIKKIYKEDIFNEKFKYLKFLQVIPYEKRYLFLRIFFFSKIKHIFFEKRVDLDFFYRKPHDLSYICNDKNFKTKNIDYIYGYFQNEKYFYRDFNLEKELVPTSRMSQNKIKNIYSKIKENSCAMHIRSFDSNDYNFTMLNHNYFMKAIQSIEKKGISKFYIFTDNVKHAKSIIQKIDKFNNYKFIKLYSLNTIEEFYLMSLFKNIIISISTFSWWAAFLGHSKKDNIVQPSIWFKNLPLPKSLKINKSIIL